MHAADFREFGGRRIRLVPSIIINRWDERIEDVKSESFQTDPLPAVREFGLFRAFSVRHQSTKELFRYERTSPILGRGK